MSLFVCACKPCIYTILLISYTCIQASAFLFLVLKNAHPYIRMHVHTHAQTFIIFKVEYKLKYAPKKTLNNLLLEVQKLQFSKA